ncbi:MAG TPA: glycosyltransferase [Blastocatellia bacterium]|jgi:glycosyltransferase involved in cell wall biosynthesis|nr:glycosyltransferase [Blastocatellia bacterium]
MSAAALDDKDADREAVRAGESTGRPRVLHLINSFEIGGTERQAVALIGRLDPERYDVKVAALRNRGPFYQEIEARFPNVPEFPLTSFYNANAVRQLARLRALMTRERIDILHAHDFYAGLIGAAAGRLAGARVIACQRHLKLSNRAVHEWGTRLTHRMAHRILVNSEAIRDHILSRGGARAAKIIVIKNGISSIADSPEARDLRDRVRRELELGEDSKLVGMVARLQPVKGHRFFLEAAARVVGKEPKAQFVLVGGGPLKGDIEDQAARLGIKGRVHLLGDRTDAARLVASFDLLVLASLHEGLPNAVMEAMAAGVPVVATAVGGTKELIADGETGYLVPPADADALSERIAFALANEADRIRVAEAARRFVNAEFGVERMVASVQRLYDELMREK